MKKPHFKILPVATKLGNLNSTSDLGPLHFYDACLKSNLFTSMLEKPFTEAKLEQEAELLERLITFNQALANKIDSLLKNKAFPILIGGDHSLAMGSWSGVIAHYKAEQKFGLIWIDAHFDLHTPDTSPSGNYHGMPVAHLLGLGNQNLAHIASQKVKLAPEHIIFIGVRDYEREEKERIESLGIQCYGMEEVNAQGFLSIFREAMANLSAKVDHIGISLDLDAFDPIEAPDVATPVPNGLAPSSVMDAILGLGHEEKIKAFEIVEYSPKIKDDTTSFELIIRLLNAFLEKKEG